MTRGPVQAVAGRVAPEPSARSKVRNARPDGTSDPDGYTRLQRWIVDRMLGLGPICRMSVEDAALVTGQGAQTLRRTRTMMAKRLGLPLDFWDQAVSHEARGRREVTLREEGGWETPYFALIVAADPTVSRTTGQILKRIEDDSNFPGHMLPELRRFRCNTFGERGRTIRAVRKRIERWRQYFAARRDFNAKSDCPFCAGIPDRRPIPGVCPVCGEEGAPEILERPSVLGSNASIAADLGEA